MPCPTAGARAGTRRSRIPPDFGSAFVILLCRVQLRRRQVWLVLLGRHCVSTWPLCSGALLCEPRDRAQVVAIGVVAAAPVFWDQAPGHKQLSKSRTGLR